MTAAAAALRHVVLYLQPRTQPHNVQPTHHVSLAELSYVPLAVLTLQSQLFGSYLCTHSRPPAHIKGSVASLRNTRVGTAPASRIPGVAVLAGVV